MRISVRHLRSLIKEAAWTEMPEAWLKKMIAEMDPDAIGGAMLLGVNGVCIIGHGSSGPTAIANAVSVAHDMVEGRLVSHLAAAMSA